ncbi:hypothetical protein ACQYAD_00280 [Neobacillus sp. SM06]
MDGQGEKTLSIFAVWRNTFRLGGITDCRWHHPVTGWNFNR